MEKRKGPRNYGFYEKFSWYVPSVADMFILLVWLLLGALLGNLLSLPFLAILGQEAGVQYATLISYPVMFIPPMIYASVKSRNYSLTRRGLKLDNTHFSPLGGALCALLAAVSTIALSFCSDAIQSLLPKMPAWIEDMMKNLTTGDNPWLSFVMVCLFAPFFEEWLCRGMVLRGLLANRVKPVWAILISALFFAAIHLNIWQAVPALMLGAMFGYVYYKTGSLKLTMLMHFTNNFMALVLSNLNGFEEVESWQDVFPGGYYWIIFAACAMLVVLTVRAFARVTKEQTVGNLDPVKPLFEE